MHRSTGFQETLPNLFSDRSSSRSSRKPLERSAARSSERAALTNWRRPTLGEFIRQVEHEFGDSVDTSALMLSRVDRDEPLAPGSVKALCDLLGVPAEDFGV